MYYRVFLLFWIVSIAVICTAVINPALPLAGLPSVDGFAGEPAMRVANGITHLTYLHRYNLSSTAIFYVRILADNTTENHLVENYLNPSPAALPNDLPTLEIDGNNIYVFFSMNGQLQKAVSTNGGVSFTINEMEKISDSLPLVKKRDGQWTSFITPSDAVSDSSYMAYTSQEMSEMGTQTYYWGPDVVHGAVRSNSDIWIKQAGGGNNNGWPIFYNPVYTSGHIQSFSGTPPYAQVFMGGVFENVPTLNPDVQTMDWYLQQHGTVVGPNTLSENRILYVTVNGASYSSWLGEIVQTGFDTLWVYSNYPPGNGAPLYANIVPRVDTLWVAGPSGTSANSINIVNSPLWIKGHFSGKQTWFSPYNIMINDNILLSSVVAGELPQPGCQDYVSLISDQRILIQYGYKNPADSLRYKPNCDGDEQGVFIYASLYAVRPDRFGNNFKDGMFTFEYQRPHPSIPASTFNGTTYDKIDMHRRHYPQTLVNTWPSNIDMPYYNPLWPEGYPYMERGTIRLFGAMAQYRKGLVHRNVLDSDFPNIGGAWNPDSGYLGGSAGAAVTDTQLGTIFTGLNAPGADGGGVGYSHKDYHFDSRLTFDTFPYNPFGLGMRFKSSTDGNSWDYKYFKSLNEPMEAKQLAARNGKKALSYNGHLLWQSAPTAEVTELNPGLPSMDKLQNLLLTNDNKLLLSMYRHSPASQDSIRLVELNPETNATQLRFSLPVYNRMNALFNSQEGVQCFANLEADGRIRFYLPDLTGNMQSWSIWNPQVSELANQQFNAEKSTISIQVSSTGNANIILSLAPVTGTGFNLYYATGQLEYTGVPDNTVPALEITTNIYPNPFKANLTLQIKSNQAVKADLAVYNLKGQKVRALATGYLLSKGEQSFTWDGLDEANKQVSSGVYFLRSNIAGQTKLVKLLKVK